MHKTHLGFIGSAMYRLKRPRAVHYAKQRLSFIIAAASVFAFIIGNMVGQHGWYAFWKSVLGKEEQVLFTGTVPPIEALPSEQWASLYGGDATEHTYSQVPKDLLVALPDYDSSALSRRDTLGTFAARVYCTANLGDYETGNEHTGSHVGIDICGVPRGTPVRTMAAGVVERAVIQEVGFGHHVMVKHWIPDEKNPEQTRVLYSTYAHLDEVSVAIGQVVEKGQKIGTVGRTGFASSYHLHVQVETADAPYHPYWIFTSQEAKQAGLSFVQAINAALHQERGDLYTLSPMMLVAQYRQYTPPASLIADVRSPEQSQTMQQLSPRERMQRLREERLRIRTARRQLLTANRTTEILSSVASSASSSPVAPAVTVTSTVETAAVETPLQSPIAERSSTDVHHLAIDHDGSFSRGWEVIRISTKNAYGDTVKSPVFAGRIALVTAFGDADFEPRELSASSFGRDGEVTVRMLPRGQRTVVIETKGAFETLSDPMAHQR